MGPDQKPADQDLRGFQKRDKHFVKAMSMERLCQIIRQTS